MPIENRERPDTVIVVGGSAGGVEAMSRFASLLPRDLPAAVLMVLHIPHNAVSVMPAILRRAGRLPAVHAAIREPLREGMIYVAPPDRHMLIRDSSVITVFGPRENGHRPAIDPLFRSAAEAYGKNVIGVLLTGNLDDGTAGLAAIKEYGGVAIVQDPDDALYSGMPESAIQNVAVDNVLPLDRIVPAILDMLASPPPRGVVEPVDEDIELEIKKVSMDSNLEPDQNAGQPSPFTCPECNGGLWELKEGALVRYRCRVGHAYSSDSLISSYSSSVEAALWAALRALEENASFAQRLANRAEAQNNRLSTQRLTEQSARAAEHANTLRGILAGGPLAAEPEHEVIAPD